jgi:hypothetical protein
MSQPAICNKCKDAGFPNESIKFEKNGTKPDGSVKWKVLNAADGTEHKHRTKEAAEKTPASDDARVDGIKELAAAIRDLAAAIRSKA